MRTFRTGEVFVHERRFTIEEVRAFTQASGDAGRHHVEPDASGRLLVQGLLTATLPTKIGGDIDFLARDMHFDFLRPVYTGDTIRCEMAVADVVVEPGRVRLAFTGACRNQDGVEVLRIASRGIVLDPAR
jgi:acyl dehydratase